MTTPIFANTAQQGIGWTKTRLLSTMTKPMTPPPPEIKDMKEEKKPEEKDKPHYQEDNLYQKWNKLSRANLDAITLFYKQIPKDTCEQFLKAISDKDFMQKIAASLESSKTQRHDDNESNPNDLAVYEASPLPNGTLLRKTTKTSSQCISLCSRPFCPKLEIQHDRRGRGVPTLTTRSEEKMVL
jgi:hypothetical protein